MANATSEKSTSTTHLNAYTVKTITDGRTVYTKIGAAFPHKDGRGFNLDLDAIPVGTGHIVCLPPKEKDTDPADNNDKNA